MSGSFLNDPVQRANALLQAGRAADALALLEALRPEQASSDLAQAVRSMAQKALGQREAALDGDRQWTVSSPKSALAWHNLGATAMDLGRAEEARSALEQAFNLGLDAPETWQVYAHAQEALGDMRGALRSLRESLKRRADPDVAVELAQLSWMFTGDAATAVAPLQSARAQSPNDPRLIAAEVKILATAGREAQMLKALDQALARTPNDPTVLRLAGQARLQEGAVDVASGLAERALAAESGLEGLLLLAAVRMAQGRPQDALALAQQAVRLAPDDQGAWGWVATAARGMGHPAYGELYDYANLVRTWKIETPEGWPSLEAYLEALSSSLSRLHMTKAHPSDQSLRQGVQTRLDLRRSEDPTIKAFFHTIDRSIRAHMAALGRGADPIRRRNTGSYEISGAWSVLLKPGGWHVDHFHPEGWLSSAFYVETPKAALDQGDRQGWIRFGQPPFATSPPQLAEHYVRPEPGMLVLFPSYMWHGTVPFTTNESRMTVAFDVVPI